MIENGLLIVNSTHKIMDITGSGRWRQGANACIFKPSVSCENEPPLEGHVSRIVKVIPGIENQDVKYETFIKEKYPILVEKGWVSVYTKICQPSYVTKDSLIMPGFPNKPGACSKLTTNNSDSKNQINLITPIQGETLHEKVTGLSGDIGIDIFKFLRPVFSAAIALVPDNGEWLVNMDLHGGNILTNKNTGLGMMSDWDQSLILTSNDIVNQVNQQISNTDPCLSGDSNDFEERYYQWWARGVDALKACKNGEWLSREEINTLRVWTIRTIFVAAVRYSEKNHETFNSKFMKYKLMGKVKNQIVKQNARNSFQLFDQILVECNTQDEISNMIGYVISLLTGDGLSQLVGGKTRRRSKKN